MIPFKLNFIKCSSTAQMCVCVCGCVIISAAESLISQECEAIRELLCRCSLRLQHKQYMCFTKRNNRWRYIHVQLNVKLSHNKNTCSSLLYTLYTYTCWTKSPLTLRTTEVNVCGETSLHPLSPQAAEGGGEPAVCGHLLSSAQQTFLRSPALCSFPAGGDAP